MIEAPNLETVKKHKKNNKDAIECIVLAPTFHKKGYEEIIQRLSYLNNRSGEKLHFYCAGYGAFWDKKLFPDMEELNIIKISSNNDQTPWAFSHSLFAKFIDDLENETKWEYSGGTEIIILGKDILFKNCIILKIDKMIKDKVIDYPYELLEALIKYSKKQNNNISIAFNEMGKVIVEEAINTIFSYLPKYAENTRNMYNKGRHYMILDLTNK